jgi:hypothetical protein
MKTSVFLLSMAAGFSAAFVYAQESYPVRAVPSWAGSMSLRLMPVHRLGAGSNSPECSDCASRFTRGCSTGRSSRVSSIGYSKPQRKRASRSWYWCRTALIPAIARAGEREGVTMFTEEIPWLSAGDKEWIMGRGVCEWLGWKI